MASESSEETFSCNHCDETFDQLEQLDQHLRDAHDETLADERSEESAATETDASASTGSITEETNASPSAAEPSEAAGPSGNEDEVTPESDDENDS